MKIFNLSTSITIAILLLNVSISFAQGATGDQITDLLEVMQAEEQFISSMESMAELQKDNPQSAMLPEGFYPAMIKEAKAGYKTELVPKIIEIYKNNLTANEVDQLIEFYKTELGQLMLTKMPQIQIESMNEGMLWGQQLGMEVAQKLMNKE